MIRSRPNYHKLENEKTAREDTVAQLLEKEKSYSFWRRATRPSVDIDDVTADVKSSRGGDWSTEVR